MPKFEFCPEEIAQEAHPLVTVSPCLAVGVPDLRTGPAATAEERGRRYRALEAAGQLHRCTECINMTEHSMPCPMCGAPCRGGYCLRHHRQRPGECHDPELSDSSIEDYESESEADERAPESGSGCGSDAHDLIKSLSPRLGSFPPDLIPARRRRSRTSQQWTNEPQSSCFCPGPIGDAFAVQTLGHDVPSEVLICVWYCPPGTG